MTKLTAASRFLSGCKHQLQLKHSLARQYCITAYQTFNQTHARYFRYSQRTIHFNTILATVSYYFILNTSPDTCLNDSKCSVVVALADEAVEAVAAMEQVPEVEEALTARPVIMVSLMGPPDLSILTLQ
jgi:hypothetical protein